MANPRWQEDLNTWLDAQARKPFSRVHSIDEILEAFDPLHIGRGGDAFAIPTRILEIYDRGQQGMEGRGGGIRRTRKWHFAKNLAKPLVPQMMNKIKQAVQTRHKINGEYTVYHTNTNSPWFQHYQKRKNGWKHKKSFALKVQK